MDSQQWRDQQQSYPHQQEHSAKVPKLLLQDDPQQQQPPASALALFVPEPDTNGSNNNDKPITTSLSAVADFEPTKISRLGGYFSLAQWQELELQALIYKYMLAGAALPLELILPIRRSLLNASPHHHYHHHPHQCQHPQPAVMQAGYWGRAVVDAEPGRCRRTDGKKWRCSRDVVSGQKYCERHMHRGRNRSRKPVETTTPTTTAAAIATATASTGGLMRTTTTTTTTLPSPPANAAASRDKTQFTTLVGPLPPPLDTLPLSKRHQDGETVNHCRSFYGEDSREGKSDGRILRRFFDDWPRSHQEPTSTGTGSSATILSISIPGHPPPTSDFSLKLSTGDVEEQLDPGREKADGDGRLQPPANWSGWGGQAAEASTGGPLAEVLRSSAATPSPTSVLQKPNCSASETSSIST